MQQNNNYSPHDDADADDEINLLEYLLVIVKHKKMILMTCVVTFVPACGLTLLMSNKYTATARILPPQGEKGGLGSTLGGMGGLASLAGVSVGRNAGALYVAMLESRTVADAIIERFDLMERYKWKYKTSAYKILKKRVNIALGKKDGVITLGFTDKDPELAAEMANAYVEELQRINVRINLNSAGRQRKFLENRLVLVKEGLIQAEEKLKLFQEKNKAIRIDDQAKAIIEAISRLKGELASKEVELGVLLSFQTEQSPQIMGLREGIAQVKDQIHRLERSSAGKKLSGDIFITTADVPEMGVQYARLLRDFKIQETVFELLTRQYEVAKIEEAKNTSTIQVLDPAVVPDRKSKPRRSKIVILMTLFFGFLAVLFAFVREKLGRMNDEDRQCWENIRNLLWLPKKL
jgi:uncharacterized protein involved in exopolysaccharide biosynthesis